MKQALISPNEAVYDYVRQVTGDRVAQVEEVAFPVARPLFWVECDDNVVADGYYWYIDALYPLPPPLPPALPAPPAPPEGGGPAVL